MLKLIILWCLVNCAFTVGDNTTDMEESESAKNRNTQFYASSRGRNSKYSVSTYKLNWYGAEQTCRRLHMRLISLKTKEIEKKIIEEIKDKNGDGFWTSGSDLGDLGDFYWMATGDKISDYTNWKKGIPTKEEREYPKWHLNPNCIYMEKVKWKYLWNYNHCTQKHHFVCQKYQN